MKPRTPWLPAHDLILDQWSGKLPASKIAAKTGHCPKTILNRQAARREAGDDLQAYHYKRVNWTRRDYLLAGAAGILIEEAANAVRAELKERYP